MAKVIICSRTFPRYHPEAGRPTFFVENIINSLEIDLGSDDYLGDEYFGDNYLDNLAYLNRHNDKIDNWDILDFWYSLNATSPTTYRRKHHTIRAKTLNKSGEMRSRWKVGDKASLRVWSGNPYCSPLIIIAPDVEIVRIDNLQVLELEFYKMGLPLPMSNDEVKDMAYNDGLTFKQFLEWFKWFRPFDGEILYWR